MYKFSLKNVIIIKYDLTLIQFRKSFRFIDRKKQRVIFLIKPKIHLTYFKHIELEFWKIDEPRSIFHSSDGRHIQESMSTKQLNTVEYNGLVSHSGAIQGCKAPF